VRNTHIYSIIWIFFKGDVHIKINLLAQTDIIAVTPFLQTGKLTATIRIVDHFYKVRAIIGELSAFNKALITENKEQNV